MTDGIYKETSERSKAGRKSLRLTGVSNKSKDLLKPGTIEPRNKIEALFKDQYGTVTPIPEATHRRALRYITAAILYIHHNKSLVQISEITGINDTSIAQVRTLDCWDQFKQQLMQAAKPSSLALVEFHDIEVIEEERLRRKQHNNDLIAEEERLVKALKNMAPGSLMQSNAIGNIERIRKLVGATIGLDYHSSEQHTGRKAAIVQMVQQAALPNKDQGLGGSETSKGSILDI